MVIIIFCLKGRFRPPRLHPMAVRPSPVVILLGRLFAPEDAAVRARSRIETGKGSRLLAPICSLRLRVTIPARWRRTATVSVVSNGVRRSATCTHSDRPSQAAQGLP